MNLSMIGSYLKAKWSKGLGNKKTDVTTKDIRLLSCFGDGKEVPVCPGLMPSQEQAGKFYCGECGCGDRRATWLNTDEREYGKLDHPYLSCPRKMPGFSDYMEWSEGDDERKKTIELTLSIKNIDPNKVKPVHPNLQEEKKEEKKEEGCKPCEAKKKFTQIVTDVTNYYHTQGETIPDHVRAALERKRKEIWEEVVEPKPTDSPIVEDAKPKCASCEKRRKELIEARNKQKNQDP